MGYAKVVYDKQIWWEEPQTQTKLIDRVKGNAEVTMGGGGHMFFCFFCFLNFNIILIFFFTYLGQNAPGPWEFVVSFGNGLPYF